MPVKFQSDRTILNTNLAASRLYETLRKDVFSDIETGPRSRCADKQVLKDVLVDGCIHNCRMWPAIAFFLSHHICHGTWIQLIWMWNRAKNRASYISITKTVGNVIHLSYTFWTLGYFWAPYMCIKRCSLGPCMFFCQSALFTTREVRLRIKMSYQDMNCHNKDKTALSSPHFPELIFDVNIHPHFAALTQNPMCNEDTHQFIGPKATFEVYAMTFSQWVSP